MKRILVIEDDAEARLVVAKILEARGYQVSQAENGRDAASGNPTSATT